MSEQPDGLQSQPPSHTSPKSQSKRDFLKLVAVAGGATTLALGLPSSVFAASSNQNGAKSTGSTLRLSRIYRFNDPKTGAPQISDFQDSPPSGSTDLEIRMKHFTEIENFTFLGYVLSHELGGNRPERIQSIQGLTVPDTEFQNLVNTAQTDNLNDEALGDTLLDIGINWEHFVASNNTLLIPGNPLKITDTAMQAKIDSLDLIAEALVAEVNARSIERKKARGFGIL